MRGLTSVGRRAAALDLSAKLAAGGDPFMRLAHAWQLLGEDRRDEAVALFEAIRGDGNDASADAATALASIAVDEERFEDAEQLLDDASRDPEQAAGARWQRARIAEERGDEIGAARLYQGIETGPRALGAQLRAHRLLREQGSPEMAEMLIDDYFDSAPGDTVEVISGVAANLVEEARGEEAIALIDRAREVLPGDALLLARAFLLERLDRVPEAVDDMRQVAKSRPNDPTALNALGYTLVDRTKSIEEGTRLIERAVAERPDSYAIQDSMGWALVQAGRFDEGKAWLDKAWEGSEDPEVAAHLGETLWRMGRTAEARKLWDEALARNPDSRPLKRAIERRTE